MKRFLIWLILILIAAGIIFFFGWTQYDLDRDRYGVIYTRTVGYLEDPIKSGEFSWSGWTLIPKNLTITQIPSSNRMISITTDQQLPSSDVYQMMVVGDPDFSYRADISVSYAVSEHAVVELVSKYGLNEKNSSTWFLSKDELIRSVSEELLSDYFKELESVTDQLSLTTDLEQHLAVSLTSYFGELEISDISVSFSRLPDFDIYAQAKESYLKMVNLKNETLAKAILESPAEVSDNMLYIDKLQNFGQLLTQYPILLEYLRIEQE